MFKQWVDWPILTTQTFQQNCFLYLFSPAICLQTLSDSSGRSRGEARGAGPFILRQNWVPKGPQKIFQTSQPRPFPHPPYLRVWIHHWWRSLRKSPPFGGVARSHVWVTWEKRRESNRLGVIQQSAVSSLTNVFMLWILQWASLQGWVCNKIWFCLACRSKPFAMINVDSFAANK